jgi:transposase
MAKKKGLRSLSVGFLPAKADSKKQKEFLGNTLMPLIEMAKNHAIELFFVDASHFVMGGFAGRVWSVVRKYVKTASGRQRYNVLGALNFVTKKIETVCNDSYITSTQVIELLENLIALFDRPIKIILDNAKYQRCKAVIEKAAELGIELIFLPTYSPNLNLIERVWKIVKSKVLSSSYLETFDNFCLNIFECVTTLHEKFADDMSSSVTENFKIIAENQLVS